jgi:GNAT superfamily N-acetyltransferase
VIEIDEGVPSVEEYRGLRASVGWTVPPPPEARRALVGSTLAVTARDDGRIVGMARVVGDGCLYALVVDVVVEPPSQGRGIGRMLVGALETLAGDAGLGADLQLVAAPEVQPFYAHLGYELSESGVMRRHFPDREPGSEPALGPGCQLASR